jgi:hypothetical protein
MSLEAIQQQAQSIADAAKLLEQETDPSSKKYKQIQQYIFKLTQTIQKYIDQERQNV